MIDLQLFQNLRLRGGFTIVKLQITSEPLIDAIGREAFAQTTIVNQLKPAGDFVLKEVGGGWLILTIP